MKRSRNWYLLIFSVLIAFVLSVPELLYKNNGVSITKGSVGNGELKNAWLLPYRGTNFKYFSFVSYYLLNNAYTNNKVYNTIISTYRNLEQSHPDSFFYVMECSDKNGGKLSIHHTHQNGMSVDFMSPKISNSKLFQLNFLGMFHYLLEFDQNGKLKPLKNSRINFELMAKHILLLDQNARKNGLRIKKVILKLDLKDNLFATTSGKQLKAKGIYFAKRLSQWTDKVHDDHYHIDFVEI